MNWFNTFFSAQTTKTWKQKNAKKMKHAIVALKISKDCEMLLLESKIHRLLPIAMVFIRRFYKFNFKQN